MDLEPTLTLTSADRVKRLRQHLNLSQRDLAEEFQITHGAVAMWESGERLIQGPSLKLLEIFEEELGLKVSQNNENLKEIESIISSRFGRNLSLSQLASKALAVWVFELLQSFFNSSKSGSQIQKKATARLAQQVVERFAEMKGLPMKLGQIISYHDLPIPPESRKLFELLQSSSVPLSQKTVLGIFKDSFNENPKDLFSKWSARPFAAASIGQVHVARLQSGQNVALKIQYPDIARAIRSDLKNVDLAVSLLRPFLGPSDTRSIVKELSDRILDECDYQKEKETQEYYYRFFAGRKEYVIPKIIPEYCRKNILCSELVEGQSFEDFLKHATKEEKNRAGEIIWQFCYESIFWARSMNADPHPGNYLFQKEAVVFLDYGCAKEFSREFVNGWRKVLLNVIAGNREKVVEALHELGMFPNGKVDHEQLWLILDAIYEPFLQNKKTVYTNEYIKRSYEHWFKSERSRKSFIFPSTWVFLTRILFGLSSVLVKLGTEANWQSKLLGILERDELFSEKSPVLSTNSSQILPRSQQEKSHLLTL